MNLTDTVEVGHADAAAWQPLRHRTFRALWIAALVANTGMWMQNVGAAWLMTSLAPSPLMVALVQSASTLPVFIFGLLGGVLADTMPRRRLLLLTQIWMLLAAALLAVLTLLNHTGAWSLLGLTFALGMGFAVQMPAWQASASDVVPRSELPAALALNGIAFNVARAIGPACAGMLILWAGVAAVFFVNTACLLLTLYLLVLWRAVPQVNLLPPERLFHGMRSGMRYVRHAPAVRIELLRTAVFVSCASALWALLPLVARDQMGLGAAGYGLLLGSLGGGAIIGALVLGRCSRRFGLSAVVTAGSLYFSCATLALAFIRVPLFLCLLLALAGACWIAVASLVHTVVQTSVPSWVRARAVAIYLLVFQGAMAIGGALWGGLAVLIGVPAALCVAGAMSFAGALLTRRFTVQLGADIDMQPSMYALEPAMREGLSADAGPIAVQVTYRIAVATRLAFVAAMQELGTRRRRNGAMYWSLCRDLLDDECYVERFIVESWEQYRHHVSRTTSTERAMEEALQTFLIDGQPALVHYLVAEAAIA